MQKIAVCSYHSYLYYIIHEYIFRKTLSPSSITTSHSIHFMYMYVCSCDFWCSFLSPNCIWPGKSDILNWVASLWMYQMAPAAVCPVSPHSEQNYKETSVDSTNCSAYIVAELAVDEEFSYRHGLQLWHTPGGCCRCQSWPINPPEVIACLRSAL